jgi:hypothetical protein
MGRRRLAGGGGRIPARMDRLRAAAKDAPSADRMAERLSAEDEIAAT